MLWPIMLPFEITLAIMSAIVLLGTSMAMAYRWKPNTVFFVTSAIAFIAFIPTCAGIMSLLDAHRFGIFHYASYGQVQDVRVERYLPENATAITLEKKAIGHRAKYNLALSALQEFIEQLNSKAASRATIHDIETGKEPIASAEEIEQQFGDLGWPPLKDPVRLESPTEADGGGAVYYMDVSTNTVYHRAGYW